MAEALPIPTGQGESLAPLAAGLFSVASDELSVSGMGAHCPQWPPVAAVAASRSEAGEARPRVRRQSNRSPTD
jgi:hypothetical protein